MSYTKLIKFDYCQLYYKIKRKNTVYQLFDIEVLINEISKRQLERKVIDIFDGFKVRIERFDYIENRKIWMMRILRLRDANLSFLVKPDEEAKPIELGDDEYLGEDMTMLFDVKNNVAMIQRNRFAVGFKNLQRMMQNIMQIEGILIDIRPITKVVDERTIQRDYFKSIELRFANLKRKDTDAIGGALGAIIKAYRSLNGGGGAFVVNLGRTKRETLAKEPTKELLDSIQQHKDVLNTAILRAKDAEDNDIDIINLFDNIFSAFISFELPERTSLDYDYCVRKMIEKYIEDLDCILDLL